MYNKYLVFVFILVSSLFGQQEKFLAMYNNEERVVSGGIEAVILKADGSRIKICCEGTGKRTYDAVINGHIAYFSFKHESLGDVVGMLDLNDHAFITGYFTMHGNGMSILKLAVSPNGLYLIGFDYLQSALFVWKTQAPHLPPNKIPLLNYGSKSDYPVFLWNDNLNLEVLEGPFNGIVSNLQTSYVDFINGRVLISNPVFGSDVYGMIHESIDKVRFFGNMNVFVIPFTLRSHNVLGYMFGFIGGDMLTPVPLHRITSLYDYVSGIAIHPSLYVQLFGSESIGGIMHSDLQWFSTIIGQTKFNYFNGIWIGNTLVAIRDTGHIDRYTPDRPPILGTAPYYAPDGDILKSRTDPNIIAYKSNDAVIFYNLATDRYKTYSPEDGGYIDVLKSYTEY